MDREVLAILRRARRLILKGWAKRAFARDSRGNDVHPFDRDACKFCASGAINRAVGDLKVKRSVGDHAFMLIAAAAGIDSTACIPSWNDNSPSKKRIIVAFDEAISIAKKAQP